LGLYVRGSPYISNYLTLPEVVTPNSAIGPATNIIAVDADHSGLNKCSRREDQLYQELERVIDGLRPYGALMVGFRFQLTLQIQYRRANLERQPAVC
jgi:hypothetical protein